MKKVLFLLVAVLTSMLLVAACDQKNQSMFHQLEGPYLGQTPPGKTPEIFAPGILSNSFGNGLIYFNAEGTEVYFSSGIQKPHYLYATFYSHLENGRWTEPVEFPVRRSIFHRAVLNPDGTRMLFISSRATEPKEGETNPTQLYHSDKTEDGNWAEPRAFDLGEEFPHSLSQASIASSGNLYFQAGYHIYGHEDLYFSRYENGQYQTPVALSEAVNGPGHEVHPFIAPDESYLIFDAGREGGFGNNDLYVSFRNADGEWSEAVNMGPNVNSARDERRSSVSTDGKYLFFESYLLERASQLPEQPMTLQDFQEYAASYKNGSANFFWVDAQVIEDLRPE